MLYLFRFKVLIHLFMNQQISTVPMQNRNSGMWPAASETDNHLCYYNFRICGLSMFLEVSCCGMVTPHRRTYWSFTIIRISIINVVLGKMIWVMPCTVGMVLLVITAILSSLCNRNIQEGGKVIWQKQQLNKDNGIKS